MHYCINNILAKSSLIFIFILLINCTDNRQKNVTITLDPNQRLEETAAGWWIAELDLTYQDVSIKNEISKQLKKKGSLRNKYIEGDHTLVKQWLLPVKKQILQTRDKFIVVYEKDTQDDKRFTVPFGPLGLFWVNILDKHADRGQLSKQAYMKLGMWNDPFIKSHRNLFTIVSPKDQLTLALYGWGSMCMEVSLW